MFSSGAPHLTLLFIYTGFGLRENRVKLQKALYSTEKMRTLIIEGKKRVVLVLFNFLLLLAHLQGVSEHVGPPGSQIDLLSDNMCKPAIASCSSVHRPLRPQGKRSFIAFRTKGVPRLHEKLLSAHMLSLFFFSSLWRDFFWPRLHFCRVHLGLGWPINFSSLAFYYT